MWLSMCMCACVWNILGCSTQGRKLLLCRLKFRLLGWLICCEEAMWKWENLEKQTGWRLRRTYILLLLFPLFEYFLDKILYIRQLFHQKPFPKGDFGAAVVENRFRAGVAVKNYISLFSFAKNKKGMITVLRNCTSKHQKVKT